MARDGLFSATMPGQTNGALVAFYVQATDAFAPPATTRFPKDTPQRECLVRFGDTLPNLAFSTYRFWITQTNLNKWINREKLSNEPLDGTFVYGNWRAIYNAGNQYAGSPYHSPGFNSPIGNNCDYYVSVPVDDAFLNATEFTLQMPGNGGGDTTCQQEQTAYWIANQLDQPFLYRRSVNVFLNGIKRGILLEDTQQPNSDFNAQWFPDYPATDLYKVMIWFEFDDAASGFSSAGASLANFTTTGGVKKLARYRQNFGKRAVQDSASNYTNIFNLVDTLATTAVGDAYMMQVAPKLDYTEWARIFATERIVGNTDLYANGGGQNCYIAKPEGGPWRFLIWDIDFAFASQQPTYNLFNFSDTPIVKLFSQPTVLRAYWQALEDAANGPLARATNVIDVRYASYQGAGVSAAAPTAMKTWIAARRDFVFAQLGTVRANFSIANNGGSDFTNASTLVTLSGAAPLSIRTITVNGTEYPVSWASITNWSIPLALTSSSNYFLVQGYDGQGNVTSNSAITVYFNGPVSSAQGSLVINEILYNPAVSNASFVEIYNRSTNTTFDLSRYRLDGIDFDFTNGMTLGPRSYLVLAKSVTAFQAAYGTSVVPAGEFPGTLNPRGETLTLLQRGGTPAQDVIIDQVKYEAAEPWPSDPSVDSSASACQLIDSAQDNARVSNWASGSGWQYFSFTGTAGLAGTNFSLFLDTAGELYLDDIALVTGPKAGVGTNLIRNGDFEAPLVDTWYVTNRAAGSGLSTNVSHTGAASLHLVFSGAGIVSGTNQSYVGQFISTNGVTTKTNTLSFWYLATTNASNLTARLSSVFRPFMSVRPILATPGASNSVSGILPPYPLLWLNEIQPENSSGLPDNTGTPQPWIELFNSGTNALLLDGFFLADTYSNVSQWAFPTGTLIGPGEFKVIFADGQSELSTGTVLHTSFRLNPASGSVVLARGSQILDYINYTNLPANFSYGSWPDGQLITRQVFYYVTPGASNNPAPVPIAINEWMAANTRTLLDPVTERYEDWFELYNFGDATINLSGYHLTDDLTAPKKWPIPAGITLAPRSFLLVWADGDTTGTNTLGQALHASFQLAKKGDEIGLFNPDGLAVDAVTFGNQNSDVSQGRFLDGNVAGVYHFMTNATPGTNNDIGGNLAAPVLSPIPDMAIDEGSLLSFTATASDADTPAQTLTFSLVAGAPFGATIHPLTGLFTWTPLESQGGTNHSITIRVTDNGSPARSHTQSFLINVNKVNSAPVLAPIDDQFLHAGETLNVAVQATDPDLPANQLLFRLGTAPAGAALDFTTGLLTWTPGAALSGTTNLFVVQVEDDGAPALSDEKLFHVIVQAPLRFSAPDSMQGIALTNGAIRLTWRAIPGRTYRVQFASELNSPDWQDIPGDVIATGDTASQTDVVEDMVQRFYRVIVLP